MENKMSLDDLRNILIAVDNQEMTVRELRTVLFNDSSAGVELEKYDFDMVLNSITK